MKDLMTRPDKTKARVRSANMIVQLPISLEYLGACDELDRYQEIEVALGELLESRGLGVCDGNDIGDGIINIFLYKVSDVAAVVNLAVEYLRAKDWLTEGCLIAAADDTEKFKIVWPEGTVGEFDLFNVPSRDEAM